MNTVAAKAPTAAQLKLNHERTATAVARLNDKAWNGTRYEAILEEGQPGVIVKLDRPYNSRYDAPYTETVRITTDIAQTIGHPVSYDNKYNASNMGTMCYRVDQASEARSRKLESIRREVAHADKLRREITEAQEALAASEARAEALRAELGL